MPKIVDKSPQPVSYTFTSREIDYKRLYPVYKYICEHMFADCESVSDVDTLLLEYVCRRYWFTLRALCKVAAECNCAKLLATCSIEQTKLADYIDYRLRDNAWQWYDTADYNQAVESLNPLDDV